HYPLTIDIYTLSYTTLFRSIDVVIKVNEAHRISFQHALPDIGHASQTVDQRVLAGHFLERGIQRENKQKVAVLNQGAEANRQIRSEEHTSELQSLRHLVCRL